MSSPSSSSSNSPSSSAVASWYCWYSEKIVQVGLSLSELHLVHTFTSVPVQESLTSEHRGKLLGDTLPYFLGGSGVTNERDSHLKTFRRNITNGGLDIVRDPLNEVRRVFIDNVKHLLIDLLSGHSTSEHISTSQVSAVSRISSTHHVLGIEGLLGELGNSKSSVLLRASGCKWSKSNHEKVKTRERDHVDGKLSEIAVQLTRETKAH